MSAAARELVLASFNPGKLRELQALWTAPGWRLRALSEFANAHAPDEAGATLIENARIKADAALRATGLPAIADDTALEVDALDGAPGVHSARYAGAACDPKANMALLLERLAAVPDEGRTARFRTVCVARFPDGSEQVGEGVLEGAIVRAPRGTHGFGYDPVFEVRGRGRTLAELDEASKNAISHRARAIRQLADRLAAMGTMA